MYEQFKQQLIDYRKQNKLSRKEMADLLYVSESLIGMYERGERNMSPEVAKALCEVAGKEINISITYKKEEPLINPYQTYQRLEKAFPEWIQLGNDNGRGLYRMMKSVQGKNRVPVTVVIHEDGLHLFKINGTHIEVNETQYHELVDNDPTPYVDTFIHYNEEKEVIHSLKEMPFDNDTNKKLMNSFQTFVAIVTT